MKTMTVDQLTRTRVLPEFRPIVALIRQLMKKYTPQAQELIAYGIPAYKANLIFTFITPSKQGITFSFSRGAQFADKYRLLQGVGTSSKHIKLKTLADANPVTLRYCLKQAPKFDASQGLNRSGIFNCLGPDSPARSDATLPTNIF